jgi:hypothetical protein
MYHPRRSGKLDREKGLAVSVSVTNCTTFGTFCQYRTIRMSSPVKVAKHLIQAHGDEIGVESPSEGGEGTTFYFTLPPVAK